MTIIRPIAMKFGTHNSSWLDGPDPQALGPTIPPSLLLRADEVIE